MKTYKEKKHDVLIQYFNQYIDQIYPAIDLYNRLVPQYNNGVLNVMHTMFLCSVIDHFGKIMRIANVNSAMPLNSGQNYNNFTHFIENYFPVNERCKSDIIYKLFRNGVMHQFFPKSSGVYWSNEDQFKNVLIRESDANLPDLNNYTFSNYIEQALKGILTDLQDDINPNHIESMHEHLILNNYGLNDGEVYKAIFDGYAAKGKTLYEACGD